MIVLFWWIYLHWLLCLHKSWLKHKQPVYQRWSEEVSDIPASGLFDIDLKKGRSTDIKLRSKDCHHPKRISWPNKWYIKSCFQWNLQWKQPVILHDLMNKITKSLYTVGLRINQAGLLTRIITSSGLPGKPVAYSEAAPQHSDGIVPDSHRIPS